MNGKNNRKELLVWGVGSFLIYAIAALCVIAIAKPCDDPGANGPAKEQTCAVWGLLRHGTPLDPEKFLRNTGLSTIPF